MRFYYAIICLLLTGCPENCHFSFPDHPYCDALLMYSDAEQKQYEESGAQAADRLMFHIEQRMRREEQ